MLLLAAACRPPPIPAERLSVPEYTDLIQVGPDEARQSQAELPHYAYIPPAALADAPAPLVLMVHGWAGDEQSMWAFRQVVPPQAAIVTPRAPLPLAEGGYIWFNYDQPLAANPASLQAAQEQLGRFLQRLPALYPIDPLRVVLVGFSQGAMLSNQFIINQPDRALGVASLAGAVPEPPPAIELAGRDAGLYRPRPAG
jgi:phospholipase/carboxylesterase